MIYNEILFAFGLPGGAEWIIIGIVGLLIFGNKLPDVGRSLGKGITEFKKGLRGIQDDIDQADVTESKDGNKA